MMMKLQPTFFIREHFSPSLSGIVKRELESRLDACKDLLAHLSAETDHQGKLEDERMNDPVWESVISSHEQVS